MKIKFLKSLKFKTILALMVLNILMLSGIYILAKTTITKQFQTVEDKIVKQNIERLRDTYLYSLDNLSIKLSDWAAWDDTYKFVLDLNSDYIKSNLSLGAISNLEISFMVYVNVDGEIVAENGLNNNGSKISLPEDLKNLIYKDSYLVSHTSLDSNKTGVLKLKDGFLKFASRPIITSDGEGPIRGTLIFGTYLDEEEVKTLSDIIHLPVKVLAIDEMLSPDHKRIFDLLTEGENDLLLYLHEDSKRIVDGYTLMKDAFGNPAFIFEIENPKDITIQGTKTTNYFLLFFSLSGIALLIFIILLIDKLLINRISKLSVQSLEIGDESSEMETVTEDAKNDEITLLQININKMINSLQKSEENLKLERDRAQAIISSMGEGLLMVDRDYKVVLLNKKAEELLEVTSDKAVGKSWSEVVDTLKSGKEVPTTERSFSVVMKSEKTLVTKMEDDHYYKTHSGKIFSIASITAPLFNGENKIIGAVKVFRDATPEKEAKASIEQEVKERTIELSEEKAKLTSAISSLPRAFAIIDPNGQITTTNGQFESIFGIQKEKWSINLIDKILDNKLALSEKTSDVLTNKKIIDIDDLEFGTKFIGIFIAPIIGDNKKLIGAILTIKDVTEDKIRERSKDEFFSIASHELRTPLTAIRGNMSMILEYYKEAIKDPELKLMITDTHDASLRLIGIVNDFLDLSRLEQKRMEFKLTSFKLNEVVLNVLKDLKATVDEKKISLISNISDNISVKADIDKLKEVLFNITGNSLKFTEKGGVTISAEVAGNFAKVRIIDTGIGIPITNQALLFHKFQQATSSTITRDGAKGTGLGLYISKLIVEGMGGTIALESSIVGKGSVFTFTLPIAKLKV